MTEHMMEFETERLRLRPFREDDAAALSGVVCDAEVMRYSDGVLSPAELPAWIGARREEYRREGFGLLAVTHLMSGELVGYCGLTRYPSIGDNGEIEVGYRFRRSAWGHGYATEAARAIRRHAFEVLGIPHLIALIHPENLGSIRVAEKLGMRCEGEYRGPGYTVADLVYGVWKTG